MSRKRKLVISSILIFLDILGLWMFRNFPQLMFPWYRNFSKGLMSVLSFIFSFTQYSLWDVILLMYIVYMIYRLLRYKDMTDWFCTVILSVSFVSMVVLYGWMFNHYAPPLADYLGLEVRPSDIEELYEAADYYYNSAVELAFQVDRDEEGHLIAKDISETGKLAGRSYLNLDNEVFRGSSYPVKHFTLIGDYLMYNGITGMFMPFTGESAVPAHEPVSSLPFTMCHEAAHRLGIASEKEANFCAYLACISSDDVSFRYCGEYEAFWYCFNALYGADPQRALELLYSDSRAVALLIDSLDENETYSRYESPLQEVSDRINDTYLKGFGQTDGIRSYGLVTDYLLAYYRSIKAE